MSFMPSVDALKQSQLIVLRTRHSKIREEMRALVLAIRHRQQLTLRYRKRCAVEARRIYLQQRREVRGHSLSGSDCNTGDECTPSAAQRLKLTETPSMRAEGDAKTEEDIVDIEGIGENPYAEVGDGLRKGDSTDEQFCEEEASVEEEERIRLAELGYAANHSGRLPDGYADLKRKYDEGCFSDDDDDGEDDDEDESESGTAASSTEDSIPSDYLGGDCEGLHDIIYEVDDDPYMSDKYEIEDVFHNLEMEEDDDDMDDEMMDIDDSDAIMSEDSQSLEVT